MLTITLPPELEARLETLAAQRDASSLVPRRNASPARPVFLYFSYTPPIPSL